MGVENFPKEKKKPEDYVFPIVWGAFMVGLVIYFLKWLYDALTLGGLIDLP